MNATPMTVLQQRYQWALDRLVERRRFAAANLLIVRWYAWREQRDKAPVYDAEPIYDAEPVEADE